MRVLFQLTIVALVINSPITIRAQEVEYTLKLMDAYGQPMKSVDVKLTEIETRETFVVKTNEQGVVGFHIKTGNLWQMDILKIKNYFMWQVKVPELGIAEQRRTVVYDYEDYLRKMRPPVDRSQLNLVTENQNVSPSEKSTKEEAVVRIRLKKKDNSPLQEFPIQLTCYKLETSYKAVTNLQGTAIFKIPTGMDYEIDLEGIESYSYIDLEPDKARARSKWFTFEPMNFKESISADTVTQGLPPKPTGTSARYFLTVHFKIGGSGPFANQAVYLHELEGPKVYKAQTNNDGKAFFMLPKGKTYVYVASSLGVFEQQILVADLTRTFGIGGGNRTVLLDPDLEPVETVIEFSLPDEDEKYQEFFNDRGIKLSNFQNHSVPYYAKSYLLFKDSTNSIGIEKGFLMTTGSVFKSLGPNDLTGATSANSYYMANNIPVAMMDGELGAFDPCILSFDVVPEKGTLFFEYVFASEEYPEYLQFDDAFGIFIKGPLVDSTKNYAEIVDTDGTISVSQINQEQNQGSFNLNDNPEKTKFKIWQYDGFTNKMSKGINVKPGETYSVTLIIFDVIDNIYDSGVFVCIKSE